MLVMRGGSFFFTRASLTCAIPPGKCARRVVENICTNQPFGFNPDVTEVAPLMGPGWRALLDDHGASLTVRRAGVSSRLCLPTPVIIHDNAGLRSSEVYFDELFGSQKRISDAEVLLFVAFGFRSARWKGICGTTVWIWRRLCNQSDRKSLPEASRLVRDNKSTVGRMRCENEGRKLNLKHFWQSGIWLLVCWVTRGLYSHLFM